MMGNDGAGHWSSQERIVALEVLVDDLDDGAGVPSGGENFQGATSSEAHCVYYTDEHRVANRSGHIAGGCHSISTCVGVAPTIWNPSRV